MARERKTVDVWEFWLDYGYGHGWELINTEDTYSMMRKNLAAYREAGYYPKIRKRRVHRDKWATHDPKKP